MLTAIDKRGFETRNTYDKRDLLIETARQGVPVLERTYDKARNLIVEADANGNETVFVYTERNELQREVRSERPVDSTDHRNTVALEVREEVPSAKGGREGQR